MSSGLFGLDFGKARIGVAEADVLGILAHPRATLDVKGRNPAKVVSEYLVAHGARTVVLGMPRQLDGRHGLAAEGVQSFCTLLAERLPGVDIILRDERLTTAGALKELRAAGKSAKSSKGIIDQAAAVSILQNYLDEAALRGTSGQPLTP